MANSEEPKEVKGRSLSPDEINQMEELRKLFKAEDGRKRLEDFAKWLFGGTTIIATLGAGFSNAAIGQLVGLGKWAFASALVFVGLSLASAALSLAPKWVEVDIDDLDSMESAVSEQFKSRKRQLRIAAVSFAMGLFLAALAPFASSIPVGTKSEPTHILVTYKLEDNGKFEAKLSATGLTPYSPVEFELSTIPEMKGKILPRQREMTDAKGKVALMLPLGQTENIRGSLIITYKWKEPPEKVRQESLEIPISGAQKG